MSGDGYTVSDFRAGQRVQTHPATSLWLSGLRYGTVVSVGRTRVHVRLDRGAQHTVALSPSSIEPVSD